MWAVYETRRMADIVVRWLVGDDSTEQDRTIILPSEKRTQESFVERKRSALALETRNVQASALTKNKDTGPPRDSAIALDTEESTGSTTSLQENPTEDFATPRPFGASTRPKRLAIEMDEHERLQRMRVAERRARNDKLRDKLRDIDEELGSFKMQLEEMKEKYDEKEKALLPSRKDGSTLTPSTRLYTNSVAISSGRTIVSMRNSSIRTISLLKINVAVLATMKDAHRDIRLHELRILMDNLNRRKEARRQAADVRRRSDIERLRQVQLHLMRSSSVGGG
ncbi:hypothetical protein BJ742DRAFT_830582 [Cladochytrium replicatum]|nr:hypothetical protein BJ742DRAFT_830582 [Cladochytrium replicatum]